MCGIVRIAHGEAPATTELSIDVAVGSDVVIAQRPNQRVNAVTFTGLRIGLLVIARHETGVIDDETHVRKHPGNRSDVAALAVFI